MRQLAATLGLLLAFLPAFAQNKNMIYLQLVQQLRAREVLPVEVLANAPTHFKITYLPQGALARWNPKTDTFEVSKTHWKKSPNASCLLPLLAHESIHAWLVKQARKTGFAWPVTLQDEAVAVYYQLKAKEALPYYAQTCAMWQAELTAERRALAVSDWDAFQTAVYERYSRFDGKELPPPPLTQPWIEQAKKNNTLVFYQHTYKLRRRKINIDKFWRKGGSWLHLSPAALAQLTQSPYYAMYTAFSKQLIDKLIPSF